MNKRTLAWTVLAIAIIAGGGFLALSYGASAPTIYQNTPAPLTTTSATTTQAATKTYTLKEVATHSSESSCWTAINGGVYDVTAWISQHPGGPDAILSLCGKDGSAAFNGQHGGQRRPASELATFKIGTL